MNVKNIKYLKEWILDKELSNEDELKIKNVIKAFSEYMVSTNPDYLYNKTYLNAFVQDFLNCKKKLKEKLDILNNKILREITKEISDRTDIVIRIDRTWISDNKGIEIMNSFNINSVKSNILKYEIEYNGEKDFSVANIIDLSINYEEKLKKDVELFIKQYKETCDEI